MPEKSQPIHQLAALLQDGKAEPVIVPARLAPSAIYDVEYRTAIVALVFERFAKAVGSTEHRKMSSARLKLLQFVTLRPWLCRRFGSGAMPVSKVVLHLATLCVFVEVFFQTRPMTM